MHSVEDARPEPRGLEIFRRILAAIGRVETAVAVVAMVAATAISVAQILLRYGTGQSLWWGQEVSILLVLVAYFVGVVRAPFTAVIIVSEATAARGMIVPMFVAALIADAVSAWVCRERLYHGLSRAFLAPAEKRS